MEYNHSIISQSQQYLPFSRVVPPCFPSAQNPNRGPCTASETHQLRRYEAVEVPVVLALRPWAEGRRVQASQ